MEIIDAYWEERNLGVKSYEVILSQEDTMEDFILQEKRLIENGAKFIVVKSPVNVPDFIFALPSTGYLFIETAFSLVLKKNNFKCPTYIARRDHDFKTRKLQTPDIIQRVYDEIAKGIFNSDRIALDKHFSQHIANNRYINWIKDLIAQGHDIHEVYYNGDPVGFFVFKKLDDKKIKGILTGIYEKYLTSGFGAVIMNKLCNTVWTLGCSSFYVNVVSNNLKALRTNLLFGFEIENISYHYVKHII